LSRKAGAEQRKDNRGLMLDMQTLRLQHDSAKEIAASLMGLVGSYRGQSDAMPIARLVGRLNALLRVHFAYEDSVVYPSLARGGDPNAAGIAHWLQDNMGTLAPQFEEFARRWSGPTIIDMMFERFRDEATDLLTALCARIDQEDDLLYPLAKRLNLPRAA
jgi:DUF438 domain-containing protein